MLCCFVRAYYSSAIRVKYQKVNDLQQTLESQKLEIIGVFEEVVSVNIERNPEQENLTISNEAKLAHLGDSEGVLAKANT